MNRRHLAIALVAASAVWAAWVLLRSPGYGYTPDPEGTARVLAEFGPQGRFAMAGDDAIRGAKGVDTFLYRVASRAHSAKYGRPWIVEAQGIGDCVSFGFAHAVYVSQSVDWDLGRIPEPPAFPATESLYGGSRVEARGRPGDGRSPVGGWSDGSYGAAAARWLRDYGVVYRGVALTHDLTTYKPDRAKSWGAYGNGGQGDAGKLDEFAKSHPARHVALVRNFDEAAAAIESGYAIAVCSMTGFAKTRDANGFAAASGSWAHCMAFVGVRYQRNGSPEDGLLCLNSWGPSWIRGPRWPEDQPEGSFWVRRDTVDRMLGGDNSDSFAVGSVDGFPHRDIDHHNWLGNPAGLAIAP